MRSIIVLALGLLVPACGYDCRAKCEDLKQGIVDTLRGRGEDPDEAKICDLDSLKNANDCRECTNALFEAYGVIPIRGGSLCNPQ